MCVIEGKERCQHASPKVTARCTRDGMCSKAGTVNMVLYCIGDKRKSELGRSGPVREQRDRPPYTGLMVYRSGDCNTAKEDLLTCARRA